MLELTATLVCLICAERFKAVSVSSTTRDSLSRGIDRIIFGFALPLRVLPFPFHAGDWISGSRVAV